MDVGAKAWTKSTEDIIERLEVSKKEGLSSSEVSSRKKKYGRNIVQKTERKSILIILSDQFKSIIMVLLIAAGLISFFLGEWLQTLAVFIVIILTALIGFFTELRAVRSMEALKKFSKITAKVRRDGNISEISAEDLVPGDIVILDSGDILSADLRLIEANKLQANESVLTGESSPVSKTVDTFPEDTPVAEQKNMVFKGTVITRGSGEGVVVSIGKHTELGKITTLVREAESEVTPLEKRLNKLGQKLVWLTLAIAGLVAILGILRGKELFLMIETAIALSVAAIPEGLPIVATIALARGMLKMAKRNALINRLSSVETLGATKVILTDKTGTLTLNKMTLESIVYFSGEITIRKEKENQWVFLQNDQPIDTGKNIIVSEIIKIGVLCNNAILSSDKKEKNDIGDPMEIALLEAGTRLNISQDQIHKDLPEQREESFDPETKMMATFHKQENNFYVAVKGAPEAIIEHCDAIKTSDTIKVFQKDSKDEWIKKNKKLAQRGLRTLAFAYKNVASIDDKPYSDLVFLGLVGLLDPPRKDVKEVISSCKKAGITVIMVTGDHPDTARNIASRVGLIDDNDIQVILGKDIKPYNELTQEERRSLLETKVFARVTPEQKFHLITLYQQQGSLIAMTGDGVNDAPALKKADIGIAMGKRGTQVAKEASDVILQDDSFSSIVIAIKYGRIIFSNIRKFVIFLLSGNMGEILAVALAFLVNFPLPILPLQILYINLILDVFPALALGVGEGTSEILQKPPRDPKEPILKRSHWFLIGSYGLLISFSILGALFLSLNIFHLPLQKSVTISFLTLTFARLGHVFNMRETGSPFLKNEIVRNKYIWAALAVSMVLILAAVYLPGISDALEIINPGFDGWLIILSMSIIPFVVVQIFKSIPKSKLSSEST